MIVWLVANLYKMWHMQAELTFIPRVGLGHVSRVIAALN
jgi:hypothetical protein